MLAEDENPFADLSELKLYVHEDGFQLGSWVHADLRIADAEIDFGEAVATCGVVSARLQLELEGCQIAPGTKLNDEGNQVLIETQKKSSFRETGITASISANIKKITEQLNLKYDNKVQIENVQAIERRLKLIQSEPNSSWKLVSANPADGNAVLSATYLSNDPLMQLGATSKLSNRLAVTAELTARRRDFRINIDDYDGPRTLSGRQKVVKERLLSILVAKSVSGASRTPRPMEKVVLSRSELKFDES